MKFAPILSVIIISYKQEKYIREAIESVLNQKTEYKYELLLADDCSPDKTLEIMEEYATKYPKIIKLLKREKNLGASNNLLDACKQSKGKYITILEGDDYWIDENKIQFQVDFMENNPEYEGITHLQEGRDLKNNIIGNFPKSIQEDCDIYIDEKNLPKKFSSSATLYKNIYIDKKHLKDIEYLFSLDKIIGDTQLCIYLTSIGKIRAIAKPMMVYRVRSAKGETNFNSTHSIDQIEMSYLNIYLKLEEFFNYKYNFYKKYKEIVTLGFIYSLLKLKLEIATQFIKKCPKKYRAKIIITMPITCVTILKERFIK